MKKKPLPQIEKILSVILFSLIGFLPFDIAIGLIFLLLCENGFYTVGYAGGWECISSAFSYGFMLGFISALIFGVLMFKFVYIKIPDKFKRVVLFLGFAAVIVAYLLLKDNFIRYFLPPGLQKLMPLM